MIVLFEVLEFDPGGVWSHIFLGHVTDEFSIKINADFILFAAELWVSRHSQVEWHSEDIKDDIVIIVSHVVIDAINKSESDSLAEVKEIVDACKNLGLGLVEEHLPEWIIALNVNVAQVEIRRRDDLPVDHVCRGGL